MCRDGLVWVYASEAGYRRPTMHVNAARVVLTASNVFAIVVYCGVFLSGKRNASMR